MTNQEKQQLSRDVAEKYGIEPFVDINHPLSSELWLHQDSARCFELAASDGFSIYQNHNNYPIVYVYKSTHTNAMEHYKNHNNDKQEATRIAILKALLAKGE